MNSIKFTTRSVSVFAVAAIAITAFTKEPLRLWLLAGAFAAWVLCAFSALLYYARKSSKKAPKSKAKKRSIKEVIRESVADIEDASAPQVPDAIRHLLLCHVNYRVSAYLKLKYPDVTWEWVSDAPEELAVNGGTGRIKLHGVDKYTHCEITIDGNARIKCDLLCIERMDTSPNSLSDADTWFGMYGTALEQTIGNLESRGITDAAIREDGAVFVQLPSGEEKTETLVNFPKKDQWERLAELVEGNDGYKVTNTGTGLYVSWVPAEVSA